MIKQLQLRGFLSFGPDAEPVALQPLNVLIGPNGSGKSNMLEAMTLLSAAATDLAEAVRDGGGAQEWLWKGTPSAKNLEIEAVLDKRVTPTKRDLKYRLRLSSVSSRLELVDEAVEDVDREDGKFDGSFYYRYCYGRPTIRVRTLTDKSNEISTRSRLSRLQVEDLTRDQSVLAQLKAPDQYPEITWLSGAFSAIRVHKDWTIGRDAAVRHAQRTDLPENTLLPDYSNLALVLNHIQHHGDWKRLLGLLKQFIPGFENVSIRISSGMAQLHMRERGLNSPIPATRMSDGTLRLLALLAALLSPTPPSVICIEQPELGLHPDAVARLAEVLMDAASRMQLFVTTYSDDLVSAFSEKADAIIACDRPGPATRLRRLDPEQLSRWLEDYRLGDLWNMGVLGANP